MDLNGDSEIPASRQKVWEALNNIEVLKNCIPGCESITQVSETELEARVVAKVGPVKAKFKGYVTLSELDPPNGYKISGEGKGGVAGFAKGSATVSLSENNKGTLLTYTVSASVGGKLAQIGSRLIDATAKKMADEFFKNFTKYAVDNAADQTLIGEQSLDKKVKLGSSVTTRIKNFVTKKITPKSKSIIILVGTVALALISYTLFKI